eukprot:GHUV01050925.1.p1 GENE.GHUV01050925.1~~GHUV01050925.1.p1  ORF type:complete len:120 (-),score=9.74 GHUV01050925.1:104-463(-)
MLVCVGDCRDVSSMFHSSQERQITVQLLPLAVVQIIANLRLREYVKEHLPSIQAEGMNVDTEAMLQGWTVSSFDDAVTLRALGYPAPHHYYRHACSTNWIPHIRTPTMIMLSRDDPFLG